MILSAVTVRVVKNKTKHRILHSCWPLNRGKNNKRTLIGTAERRTLNRGGRLKGVIVTEFADNSFGNKRGVGYNRISYPTSVSGIIVLLKTPKRIVIFELPSCFR